MAEELTIEETFDFIDEITKFIDDNRHRVPYHLNLIDELHINENAHSRILCQLLRYQNIDGRYVFLESLFKYLADKCGCESFVDIVVNKPFIPKPDTCRIDLWVLGDNYAVIFENKIYEATDQTQQLMRYIDRTAERGYEVSKLDGNIYVVYLPDKDEQNPSEQTWGPYKEAFRERYAKASFESVILPWLNEEVLPAIHCKDELFKCAVVQYINYLERQFGVRKSDKILDDMVHEEIKNILKAKLRKEAENEDKLVNKLEEYSVKLLEIQENIVDMLIDEDCRKMSEFIREWVKSEKSIDGQNPDGEIRYEDDKKMSESIVRLCKSEKRKKDSDVTLQIIKDELYIQVWYFLDNTMTIALVHSTDDKATRNKELDGKLGGIFDKYSKSEGFASCKKRGLAPNKYCQLSQVGHIVGRNFLYELLEKLENNKDDIKDAIKKAKNGGESAPYQASNK